MGKLKPAILLFVCFAGSRLALGKGGKGDGVFDVMNLPLGRNVTIPRPATTLIPLASRVQLTGTDLPQTISFRPVNMSEPYAKPISVKIYDQKAHEIAKVTLNQSTPYLYSVKDLNPITVVVEGINDNNLKLKVESDKPLDIAR